MSGYWDLTARPLFTANDFDGLRDNTSIFGYVSGMMAFVRTTATGDNLLMRWDANSSDADNDFSTIKPNSVPALNPGRWICLGRVDALPDTYVLRDANSNISVATARTVATTARNIDIPGGPAALAAAFELDIGKLNTTTRVNIGTGGADVVIGTPGGAPHFVSVRSETFVEWLIVDKQMYAPLFPQPISGGSFAIDFDNSQNMAIDVMTTNITITGFTNLKDGAIYTVEVTQDATGSRTVTWPVTALFIAGDDAPSPTANTRTVWMFRGERGTPTKMSCIAVKKGLPLP